MAYTLARQKIAPIDDDLHLLLITNFEQHGVINSLSSEGVQSRLLVVGPRHQVAQLILLGEPADCWEGRTNWLWD